LKYDVYFPCSIELLSKSGSRLPASRSQNKEAGAGSESQTREPEPSRLPHKIEPLRSQKGAAALLTLFQKKRAAALIALFRFSEKKEPCGSFGSLLGRNLGSSSSFICSLHLLYSSHVSVSYTPFMTFLSIKYQLSSRDQYKIKNLLEVREI